MARSISIYDEGCKSLDIGESLDIPARSFPAVRRSLNATEVSSGAG